mgnify:CR=1 FL=1
MSGAAADVGVVVLAVSDPAVADVAAAIEPGDAPILHLAGSLGLDVLAPHAHAGSVHPLVALPDPERGAARLRGAHFAIAHADDDARRAATLLVETLDGNAVTVSDEHRVTYHAAAAVAANHLVALLGQVERIAVSIGVPLDAYLDLARGALDDVAAHGPTAALTGPVARGDLDTVARHLAAIEPDERAAYEAMAACAQRLVDGHNARPAPVRRATDRTGVAV